MYSLFIFLIAFVLFLFEIIVSQFFWKTINSNILILTLIMILPWLFMLIQWDSSKWRDLVSNYSKQDNFIDRKSFFIFEKLESYSILIWIVSLIYLGLFILLHNSDGVSYCMISILFCLIIMSCARIAWQIFTHS